MGILEIGVKKTIQYDTLVFLSHLLKHADVLQTVVKTHGENPLSELSPEPGPEEV